MKDVIEAGEYVRTENGKIDKVVSNNYYMEKYIKAEKDYIFCNNIVKHSKQLKELLEFGDIVKYRLKNFKYTNVTRVNVIRDVRSNKESILIDGYNLEQINRMYDECRYSMRTLQWVKEDLLKEENKDA